GGWGGGASAPGRARPRGVRATRATPVTVWRRGRLRWGQRRTTRWLGGGGALRAAGTVTRRGAQRHLSGARPQVGQRSRYPPSVEYTVRTLSTVPVYAPRRPPGTPIRPATVRWHNQWCGLAPLSPRGKARKRAP